MIDHFNWSQVLATIWLVIFWTLGAFLVGYLLGVRQRKSDVEEGVTKMGKTTMGKATRMRLRRHRGEFTVGHALALLFVVLVLALSGRIIYDIVQIIWGH